MFFQGAALELLLVFLALGVPILLVVCYQWGERNGMKQMTPNLIMIRDEYGNARMRQALANQRKDDHIFNTVREWRNDLG
jgi:hypothetical protein